MEWRKSKENIWPGSISVQKGTKDTIKAHAEEQGESLNGYIKKAVADRYKGDTGNDIEL